MEGVTLEFYQGRSAGQNQSFVAMQRFECHVLGTPMTFPSESSP